MPTPSIVPIARIIPIIPIIVALVTGVLVGGCGGEGASAEPDADTDDPGATWHTALSGLDSALLSVWGGGHDDLWFVGADRRDGKGPMVVHGGPGRTFRRLDLRAVDELGGHLWWVHGDTSAVWTVGDGGRAFRFDRVSQTWSRVETGTTATLYGVWGAPGDGGAVWAVGGHVLPAVGPPVVVRLTADGGEVVADLPEEVLGQGTFFKVWGKSKDDVWVVGEQGRVVHFDGSGWKVVPLGAAPRLVTVHGAGDELVLVGGSTQAVILERAAPASMEFVDRSPSGETLLSGVFVGDDGQALAVGMVGLVMRREASGGTWSRMAGQTLTKDWHAVWRDGRGDWWVVGGNLLSASRFDEGAILRFGPARSDLPTGGLVDLDPVRPDDGPEVSEVEVVEVGPEPEEVEEVEVAEVEPEVEVDVEVVEDVDTSEVVTPGQLELGTLAPGSGEFIPVVDGQKMPLVHGPQGGFHVEGILRFAADTTIDPLESAVELSVWVEGQIRGRFKTGRYPVPRAADGVYQTYLVFAIFCEDPPPGDCFIPLWDSSAFDGKTAMIKATVTPTGGATLEREWVVTLEDTL